MLSYAANIYARVVTDGTITLGDLVERDRVSADGGNGAPLGLPGIEIRGREDNLVADPPAGRVQDLD